MSEIVAKALEPAVRPAKPVHANIPPTRRQREALLAAAQAHALASDLVPPVSLEELAEHGRRILTEACLEDRYQAYAAVLLNNELWQETVAGVPFHRRLLLLPQCLRNRQVCQAKVDPCGLLCRKCGGCLIGDLKAEAEALGYVVLVAEGSPVVSALLQTGKIDAVIGVGCLATLEGVFPYMEAAAIPGLAIPLLQDGCVDTTLDADWLWNALYLTRRDATRVLDIESLRRQVESWFTPVSLTNLLGPPTGHAARIAQDWLARAGKRWRPFLAVCAYAALSESPQEPVPRTLRRLALAVECFHKASLIHDDIEDHDLQRYGRPTLHEEHGVEIALNVGDFLLGEGYRLIAECATERGQPALAADMLAAAASGHRDLCIGQGEELTWRRRPVPLSVEQVLEIYRLKTAPAFRVALSLGSLAAGASDDVRNAFGDYSEALGIAYQIRDDLQDWAAHDGRAAAAGPSILVAIAHRRGAQVTSVNLHQAIEHTQAFDGGRRLLEQYKQQAVRSLRNLDNPNLKGLLRRVVGRIFHDVEPLRCCDDHKAGDAGRGRAGPKPAG